MKKISIIIFNKKWDLCGKTIESILANKKENISDIIVINRTEECKKKDLEELSKKYKPYIKYIELEEKKDNILDYAIKMTKGDYISIIESGVVWNENVISEIENINKKENYDFYIMRCTNDLQISAYTKFLGMIEKDGMINLYNKYRTFHIFYPSYIVSREIFECNNICVDEDIFNIMEKMFWLSANAKFGYVLEKGNFEWDECATIKDFELAFKTKQESVADYLNNMIDYICNNARYKDVLVPKNAQYQIANYIKYLFKDSNKISEKVTSEKLESLKENLHKVINKMSVNMITTSGNFTAIQKKFLFDEKDNVNIDVMYKDNNEFIFVENEKIIEAEQMAVSIQFVELEENFIRIEGYVKTLPINKELKVFVRIGEKEIECNYLKKDVKEYWFDKIISAGVTFDVKIDLSNKKDNYKIEFLCKCDEKMYQRKRFIFGKYAPLANKLVKSYFNNNGWILSYNEDDGCFVVDKSSKKEVKKREKELIDEIKKIDEPAAKKAVIVRKLYFLKKKIQRKDIWLVSDRINHGDDNGEAFFRALHKNKEVLRKKKVYFVIDKNTKEFKELRKFGKTISTLSWQHKLNHLLSEYVISAHANNPVVNIFGIYSEYYKDILCRSKFVFLQHGVTKDDQSEWLNKYNRNIHGLIVTTQAEYESMFNYNYFYDKSRIWLTGMPRYDRLYHAEKKYITFMPTWRKSLTTGADPVTGIWKIRDDFKVSSYYQFYNSMLNDERLLKEAKKYGYTICFMPHPNIAHAVNQFKHHKDVIFLDSNKCYRDVFAETDLMLTDYSSVAFDFAYLRKPIIYTQYDKEEFFSGGHSYTEGYYDYETDGFGEVETEYEAVVDRIIEYMENNCKLKTEYLERINSTFAYDDKNCCKRIVDLLLNGYQDK